MWGGKGSEMGQVVLPIVCVCARAGSCVSGVLARPSQEVLVGKEIWFRDTQEMRSRTAREGQCPARVSGAS